MTTSKITKATDLELLNEFQALANQTTKTALAARNRITAELERRAIDENQAAA